MKIIEGLKLIGRPADIPDCSRDDLPEFFKEMGFTVGAEIGSYAGEYTEKFCKAGLTIYAIDPWKAYEDYNEFRNQGYGMFQSRQDYLYEETKKRLAPYGDKAIIVRKTSMEAVEDFQDGSLDFVYIDGHHGFKYVAEDLWDWTKKVKKGGVISGHDWARNKKPPRDPYCLHVQFVVDAFVRTFEIKNFYIIGRHKPLSPDEKRDKWRSWFWINE